MKKKWKDKRVILLAVFTAGILCATIILASMGRFGKTENVRDLKNERTLAGVLSQLQGITGQMQNAIKGKIVIYTEISPKNGTIEGLEKSGNMKSTLEFDNTKEKDVFTYQSETDSDLFRPVNVKKDEKGYYKFENGEWVADESLTGYQDFAKKSLAELTCVFKEEQIAGYDIKLSEDGLYHVVLKVSDSYLKEQSESGLKLVSSAYEYTYTKAGRVQKISKKIKQESSIGDKKDVITMTISYTLDLDY